MTLAIDSAHPLADLAAKLRAEAFRIHGPRVRPVQSRGAWSLSYTTMSGKLQLWYDRPVDPQDPAPDRYTTGLLSMPIPPEMQRFA